MGLQTLTATEPKTHFSEFIARTQQGSVRVTRRNRLVGVMVSAEDFEAMRTVFADRLRNTLVQTAAHAQRQGLTAQQLAVMLADG